MQPTDPPIVIAEDDNVTARLITESLKKAGYTVVRVANGQFAIDELKKHQPRVLVLDINMPRRDGLEVLRILKRSPERQNVRVLILSGHAQPDVEQRARRDGADDYLVKPFAPSELIDRVRRLTIRDGTE
jgi:DNA-binding response OmpR family regulator